MLDGPLLSPEQDEYSFDWLLVRILFLVEYSFALWIPASEAIYNKSNFQ